MAGEYSRRAWFPSLGAEAWLVWGSIAGELGRYRRVACLADDLAHAHLMPPAAVGAAVDRLVRFGLAAGPPGLMGRPGAGLAGSAGPAHLALGAGARIGPCGDVWQVRRACPPLSEGLLARAPVEVVAMHLRLFGDGLHARPSHRWRRRHRPRLASGRAS